MPPFSWLRPFLIAKIQNWNRDWAGIDRFWCIILIPGNYFLLWQGVSCHGKCEWSSFSFFFLSYVISFSFPSNFAQWYRACINNCLMCVILIRSSSYQEWCWPLDWNPPCNSLWSPGTTRSGPSCWASFYIYFIFYWFLFASDWWYFIKLYRALYPLVLASFWSLWAGLL